MIKLILKWNKQLGFYKSAEIKCWYTDAIQIDIVSEA